MEFFRNRVCSQEGRDTSQRAHARDHPQQFTFVFQCETVARLGFDGGGSGFEKPANVPACSNEQFVFRCGARLTNRGHNTAVEAAISA